MLTNTGSGTSSYPRITQTLTSLYANKTRRFFFTAEVMVTTTGCSQVLLEIWDGTALVSKCNQPSPVANTWYKVSCIADCTFTTAAGFIVSHTYSTAANANGKVMQVKNFMAIDMGADTSNSLYGFTKSIMSGFVSDSNGYWEGTKNVGGVTCTIAADGTITLNGTALADATWRIDGSLIGMKDRLSSDAVLYNLINGLNYTFSRTDVSGSRSPGTNVFAVYCNSGMDQPFQSDGSSVSQTVMSIGQAITSYTMYYVSGTVFTNYVFRLQLKQSAVVTPWIQSQHSTLVITTTLAVGDTLDYDGVTTYKNGISVPHTGSLLAYSGGQVRSLIPMQYTYQTKDGIEVNINNSSLFLTGADNDGNIIDFIDGTPLQLNLINGITYSSSNELMTLNGTATEASVIVVSPSIDNVVSDSVFTTTFKTIIDQLYTFSINVISGSAGKWKIFMRSGPTDICNIADNNLSTTFVGAGQNITQFYIVFDVGTIFDNFNFNLQLRPGNDDIDWFPYGYIMGDKDFTQSMIDNLPHFWNTDPKSVSRTILTSLVEQLRLSDSNVQYLRLMLTIDPLLGGDLDKRWGKLFNIPRIVNETDEQYAFRLKAFILKANGGTAPALKLITITLLNITDDSVMVYDAWKYIPDSDDTWTYNSSKGAIIVEITLDDDTNVNGFTDILTTALNNAKASGVLLQIHFKVRFSNEFKFCGDNESTTLSDYAFADDDMTYGGVLGYD